jgi:membrane protease YdiL (CAAX protease family)
MVKLGLWAVAETPFSETMPPGPSAPGLDALPQDFSVLLGIDVALFLTGLAMLASTAVWLALRGEDPLRAAPPRQNRFREDSVAVVVATYLTTALLLSVLLTGHRSDEPSVLASVAIGNGAQLAGAAVCLFLARRQFDGGPRRFVLGDPQVGWRHRLGVAGMLSIGAVGICPAVAVVTAWLIVRVAPTYELPEHPTLEALAKGQPLAAVVALWIGAAVVAPAAEELFFRGLLQTWLVTVLERRRWAIAGSAVAFGLVHYQQPHAVPALMVLGVMLGFAYERTGSLLPAMIVHSAFNTKTLIWEAVG